MLRPRCRRIGTGSWSSGWGFRGSWHAMSKWPNGRANAVAEVEQARANQRARSRDGGCFLLGPLCARSSRRTTGASAVPFTVVFSLKSVSTLYVQTSSSLPRHRSRCDARRRARHKPQSTAYEATASDLCHLRRRPRRRCAMVVVVVAPCRTVRDLLPPSATSSGARPVAPGARGGGGGAAFIPYGTC